jgi:hypothetical protein
VPGDYELGAASERISVGNANGNQEPHKGPLRGPREVPGGGPVNYFIGRCHGAPIVHAC